MKILSIDPSLSSTGYSVIDSNTRTIYDINKYTTTKNNKINSIDDENDRIKRIVLELHQVFIDNDASEVAMEDGFISSVNAKSGLQLGKLRGAIIAFFLINNIPIHTQQPSETRKNLGLKGNAKKEEVANKILEIYPELLERIGPYSDKQNKQKTSDMYDSVCIGIAHLNKKQE